MLDEEKTKAQLILELRHFRGIAKKLEGVGIDRDAIRPGGENDKSFQCLVEGLDAAVFILQSRRIKYINQAGVTCFGKNIDRLYAPKFWELVHPAFQSLVKSELEQIRDEKRTGLNEDVKVIHPVRGVIWLNLNLSRIQYEGHPSILGMAFDVTDRKQKEEITSILFRISNAIGLTQDLGELFQKIHLILKEVIAAPNFFLSFISDGRIKLDFPFYTNKTVFHRPLITNIQEPIGLQLNLAVIKRRTPLYYQKSDLRKLAEQGEITAEGQLPEVWLGVPLKVRGKTIGCLCVQHHNDAFFYREQDIDLMVAVSEQVALAVERKTTQEILRFLATTDSLTGLHNRRHFTDLARRELERTRRYRHGLSILMIDIDHFKSINDEYGHLIGDEVLANFAKLMKENLREVDILGRLGGEAFAVLMPMTRTATALEVAERLRHTIEKEAIPTSREPIKVTISGGVASYRKGMVDIDELIIKADQGLYTAKRKGRNRIEIMDVYTQK